MNPFKLLSLCCLLAFSTLLLTSCKETTGTETGSEQTDGNPSSTYKEAKMIGADEFEKGMKKNNAVLLDVRMPQEFEQGHIEGAVNINFFDPNFKNQLLDLDKKKKYYMYCKNDSRSERAAEFLLQNDFPEVYVLEGGYAAWKAGGKQ